MGRDVLCPRRYFIPREMVFDIPYIPPRMSMGCHSSHRMSHRTSLENQLVSSIPWVILEDTSYRIRSPTGAFREISKHGISHITLFPVESHGYTIFHGMFRTSSNSHRTSTGIFDGCSS